MNAADFWNDQKRAQKIIRETNQLKGLLDTYESLSAGLSDLAEGISELSVSFDPMLPRIL